MFFPQVGRDEFSPSELSLVDRNNQVLRSVLSPNGVQHVEFGAEVSEDPLRVNAQGDENPEDEHNERNPENPDYMLIRHSGEQQHTDRVSGRWNSSAGGIPWTTPSYDIA
jgi:hypothetical protein